ncbi:acetylajmalan esterase [Dorcoceras hygrometricum]|uniref:Acetylajmalan esterase n=1 Tax=Dorcoceras hygrometricum TaxID=472368 RepID=A0A2Z7BFT1_9LAMI|nr:acetylajmalan esterase [Dorcoceras hygrometricum]
MPKFEFICLTFGLFVLVHCVDAFDLKKCYIDKIYQLGDSLSDTGNYIRESSSGAQSAYARLPYGQDFYGKKPTGRCSNGLLIIDYLAMASGLPFLNPYQNRGADFTKGNNFATAGATALPVGFLKAKNIASPFTSTSLDVQLDRMLTHFDSICHRDCREFLKNSLFLVGEIGINDYGFSILQGKTIQQTTSLVPDVVFAIQKAIRRVIEFGAARIVVPGLFPMGCGPVLLTKFPGPYDEYHCLKPYNDLAKYHNQKLMVAIEEVRREHPNVIIVYADYYAAYLSILRDASKLGLDPKAVQKACCGIGGAYNFNLPNQCGNRGVPVCATPQRYLNWDGIHLTQEAYKDVAQLLIQQIYPHIRCDK